MNIQIMPKDVFLTLADKTYIRNRLYYDLAANHEDIDTAEVSLCAIPGFESESMHHCRVEIQLINGSSLIGDSTEADIYVAIDRAVDRSCARVNSSDKPRWRAFSQSGSNPFRHNQMSAAASGHDSV